jgi:N-acetylglutamate synthase-like GNAT family acetyltransferase
LHIEFYIFEMKKAIVRKGKREDVVFVMQLVKELAEFEKALIEVENTKEQLEEDCFGENKICDFFVAEWNGVIIGMALYYIKYSTWKGKCIFLEDIIVTNNMRGKGIGAILFEEVARAAAHLKVKRMEWQVLDWNEPAIQFYKKYNASLDPEWINGKLTFDQLQEYL